MLKSECSIDHEVTGFDSQVSHTLNVFGNTQVLISLTNTSGSIPRQVLANFAFVESPVVIRFLGKPCKTLEFN